MNEKTVAIKNLLMPKVIGKSELIVDGIIYRWNPVYKVYHNHNHDRLTMKMCMDSIES